jgi:hypothetical protein
MEGTEPWHRTKVTAREDPRITEEFLEDEKRSLLTYPCSLGSSIRIVVGLAVSGSPVAEDAEPEANRWQVLMVESSGVVEICSFDDRDDALARTTV